MFGCSQWVSGSSSFFHFPGGDMLGLLIQILIMAGVVWLVLRAIGLLRGKDSPLQDKDHSLHILKLRLARGEISEEEYRRMREVLEG